MIASANARLVAENYIQSNQVFKALEIYGAMIAANPRDAHAWIGVGMVMVRSQQWEQAAENFRFALTLEPGHPIALHGLSMALLTLGDPQAACETADAACLAAPYSSPIHAWRANAYAVAGCDPARTLEYFKDWGRKFADPLTDKAAPLPKLTPQQRDPSRRLKVGYVSGDLRLHSIAFFMEPVLAHHDPALVEIFVYSTGEKDAVTQRMAAHVTHWHDVFDLTDEELCGLIRGHQIDVLVDLSGHTAGHRLLAFARRAAPVQVTWLGYHYPVGMKAMDYRLTESSWAPPGSERHYSEQLFKLSCAAPYAPPLDAPLVLDPPMLKHGHPTLISLHNSKKVTDHMLMLWGEILARRPDAQLILMAQEIDADRAMRHMMPRLEALHLPIDRIRVSPQLPLGEFMALGGAADIALDTTPQSGLTTTFHALWMGLPVVTREGTDVMSGACAGTLRSLGYADWVASDDKVYIDKVLKLMNDVELLRAHRRTVRQRMQRSPTMDYAARTAELERAYRMMWMSYLAGAPRELA